MKLRITKHQIVSFLATTFSVLGFLLSFSIITATPTHAACFNPAGNAGNVTYNGAYRTIQYCNGGSWVRMGGGGDATSGLVGWWKLDDGAGTSAADSTGKGNTGTLTNSPAWTTGMNGGALTFNGSTNYVSVPDSSSLHFVAGSFSVSVWMKATASPLGMHSNEATLIGKESSSESQGWAATFNDDGTGILNAQFWIRDAATNQTIADSPRLYLGQWYHLVFVVDRAAAVARVYLNGAEYVAGESVTTGIGSLDYANSLFMGAERTDNMSSFTGTIDDARVYSRALSAADVMALYTSTGGASGDINSNLVGYWKFDEGSGTSAADSSGAGNTGTTQNAPTWGAGKINNALTLNGTTQRVNVPDAASLRLAGSWTVSSWVNAAALPASGQRATFVDRDDSSGNGNYLIGIDNTASCTGLGWRVKFDTSGGVSNFVCYVATINTGTWYHLTGVWDSTAKNLMIYLNGALVATQNIPSNVPTSNSGVSLALGTNVPLAQYFNGTIDDVRVYNRALSPSDVLTLYNTTATACASPVGYAGDMIYNAGTYHVPQYCDGTNWKPLGKVPGAGGAGCSSPAFSEGNIMYNSSYRTVQYCDGTTWRTAGGNVPIPGLVGWWNFDEGSGTSAADSSGGGSTGILTATNASFVAGKVNNAVSLTHTGTNVSGLVTAANPSNFSFEYNQPFSLAAWVYRNANTEEDDVIGKEDPSNSFKGYALWFTDTSGQGNCAASCLVADFENATGSNRIQVATAVNAVSTGAWHHLVMTYDGSGAAAGVNLYVDGSAVAMTGIADNLASSTILNTMPLQIGADGDGDGTTDIGCCTFGGKIDDARVYSRALSASEVWRLYNGAP